MVSIVPDMIRLASYRTVYGFVSRYFRDPRLRVVMSFHPLLIGGNPFTATSIYCLIAYLERQWGVHFAMGGTGQLVKGLVSLIEGQNGTVRCGQEVTSIIVKDATATGVRLASGEEIAADVVVSNADSAWTYRHLLAPDVRRRWTDRRIERARYSMSLFVWYFGTQRRYPDVPHHTILLGPRYHELLARHLRPQGAGLRLQPVPAPADRHRPLARAARLRCLLCAVAGAASRQRHRLAREGGGLSPRDRATSRRDHAARSRRVRRHLPGDDPQDFQDRLLSFRGAAFGLEPILTQSAWFRPHNRSEDIKRPLSRRRRNPSGCRTARRAVVRPRSRFHCSRCSRGGLKLMHTSSTDLAACRDLLRGGSRTFFAATHILPRRLSEPATALYAFCRLADDAVDVHGGKVAALDRLRERLDRAYQGRPLPFPSDRAFAETVARHAIPRTLPEALLEGLAWDAQGRRYDDLAELTEYAMRVAGSVGAMMSVLMGARAPHLVARACDLGVAMQFTNIARDVGEDAREGRIYLPTQWLRDAGIDPDAWLTRPTFTPALGDVVRRLLQQADLLYARAGAGIAGLPLSCQPGIRAAGLLYAEIGKEVERRGFELRVRARRCLRAAQAATPGALHRDDRDDPAR